MNKTIQEPAEYNWWRAVLEALPNSIRADFTALCPHQGAQQLCTSGPRLEIIGWQCLECGQYFRGRP